MCHSSRPQYAVWTILRSGACGAAPLFRLLQTIPIWKHTARKLASSSVYHLAGFLLILLAGDLALAVHLLQLRVRILGYVNAGQFPCGMVAENVMIPLAYRFEIWPLCRVTMAFAVERPIPYPPVSLAREESAR